MRGWLDELERSLGEPTLEAPQAADIDGDAEGFGHANATRGTLMHWVRLGGGRIGTYQVITPTTWNASPRHSRAGPGHFEQSLVGLPAGEAGLEHARSSSGATTPASSARPSESADCAAHPLLRHGARSAASRVRDAVDAGQLVDVPARACAPARYAAS